MICFTIACNISLPKSVKHLFQLNFQPIIQIDKLSICKYGGIELCNPNVCFALVEKGKILRHFSSMGSLSLITRTHNLMQGLE